MMNTPIFEYYQEMEARHIILSFKGVIYDRLLVHMVESIKLRLSQSGLQKKIIKDVYTILIELAQNISAYSSEINGQGIIMLESHDQYYRIRSGNMIRNTQIPHLRRKIRTLNRLDPAGLRQLYHKNLKIPKKPGKITGNIGLIIVARKSGNPIDLRIRPVDTYQSFIEISAKINKEETNG